MYIHVARKYCRYLNPYIKLKLIEWAIKLYQEFLNKLNCGIFSAVLLNQFFHLKGTLKLKGKLFVCLQIWTVASLNNDYKQETRVCECLVSKYFFFESDFCTITPHFFNPISKMFCNFSLQLNMAKRRHVFLALWVRKLRRRLN